MVRISDIINKPLKKFANSNLMESVCKHYRENDGKYIAAFSVGALIAKDTYSCAIYVAKNERNKNIPEDKKRFISMLDIMNYVLTTAVQLIAYFTISKKAVQNKIFNKVLGKYFSPQKISKLENKLQLKFPEISPKEIAENVNRYMENVEVAFEHLFSLATTAILAKRVIVPIIATPLADKAERRFLAKS